MTVTEHTTESSRYAFIMLWYTLTGELIEDISCRLGGCED